jgi:hypothetical protein
MKFHPKKKLFSQNIEAVEIIFDNARWKNGENVFTYTCIGKSFFSLNSHGTKVE